VWKVYDIIAKKGPIGRKALSSDLDIGEGSVRTILDKMLVLGDIRHTKKGSIITDRGRTRFEGLGIEYKYIDKDVCNGLTISDENCAVHIRLMANFVDTGQEQCREAQRSGADGATTLVVRNGILQFPDDALYPHEDERAKLANFFDLRDNDVLIVSSADTREEALRGGISAALFLNEEASKCGKSGWGCLTKTTDSSGLRCAALTVHELMGRLPVTMRSKDCRGVRCENGYIIDTNYTGPVLEEVLEKNCTLRKVSSSGPYKGVPIVAVPILENGKAIAVVAAVDITRGAMFEMLNKTWGRTSTFSP
jgi:predicted transcriptional regulator